MKPHDTHTHTHTHAQNSMGQLQSKPSSISSLVGEKSNDDALPSRCACCEPRQYTHTHTHTYGLNDGAPVSRVPCKIQHWALTNQINPGLTSVDRNATTTLAPYNAWFQLSHLHTTYHLHTFQFKVPAGHLAAMCVHMEYGSGLVLLTWMWKWWSSLLGKHGFRLRGIQSYSNRW